MLGDKDPSYKLLIQNKSEHQMVSKLSFRYTKMRYVGLILACQIMIGSYYCYDNPGALQTHLQERLNINTTQYNMLYSVYSFPNIILPFLGGFLLDKIGVRYGIFIFTLVLIIGQFVFMLGGYQENYDLMIIGRIIFGIGGECLVVSQSVIVSQWFKDDNLAFALGTNISFSRLGSSLNTNLTPRLFEVNNSFFLPMFVGLCFCVYSFFCGLVLIWMDYESDKREGIQKQNASFVEDEIRMSDIKKFSKQFWILTFNCFLIYGAFFSFNNNSNDFLNQMFGIETKTAGSFITVVFLTSALITPIFGVMIDKFGKIGYMMLCSLVLFALSQVIFLIYPADVNQYMTLIPLGIMGLFYATYAAIFWPCIPLIVDKNVVGTAYGVVNSVQNLNLAVSPLIFGAIHDGTLDKRSGYFWPEIFIISQIVIGIFSTVIVNIIDSRTGNILNKKPDQKTKELMKSTLRKSFR